MRLPVVPRHQAGKTSANLWRCSLAVGAERLICLVSCSPAGFAHARRFGFAVKRRARPCRLANRLAACQGTKYHRMNEMWNGPLIG